MCSGKILIIVSRETFILLISELMEKKRTCKNNVSRETLLLACKHFVLGDYINEEMCYNCLYDFNVRGAKKWERQ